MKLKAVVIKYSPMDRLQSEEKEAKKREMVALSNK